MPKYRVPVEFEAMDDEHARGLAAALNAHGQEDDGVIAYVAVTDELAREEPYWRRVG